MKSYVITITDNEKSVAAANRCIASAKKFGIDTQIHDAITPQKGAVGIAHKKEVPINGFKERFSRFQNCLSAFLSHLSLWEKCIELNEPIIIFEHDAVVMDALPIHVNFDGLLSIGEPSYGQYGVGHILGVNKLFSKQYLPGAHAYMLKPKGARELVRCSKTGRARPTDVYLNNTYFPWIQEYYPWPVVAKDTFTTIQNEEGCIAKHNFNAAYEII